MMMAEEFKQSMIEEPGLLTVYAIPYFGNQVVFVPCPGPIGHVPATVDEENEVMQGEHDDEWKMPHDQEDDGDLRMMDEDMKHKFGRKTSGLKNWWQKKRKQRFDNESAMDKFLKRIPKGKITHLRILHPSSIESQTLMEDMQHQVSKAQARRSARVIGYTAALPFALLMDLLTFAFVFTVADLAMIYSNSKKLHKGTIVEDLMAKGLISFEVNSVLEKFHADVQTTKYTMPSNLMIQELCFKLGIDVMAKTIRKVRNAEAAKLKIDLKKFEDDEVSDEQPAQKFPTLQSYASPPQYAIEYHAQ